MTTFSRYQYFYQVEYGALTPVISTVLQPINKKEIHMTVVISRTTIMIFATPGMSGFNRFIMKLPSKVPSARHGIPMAPE